MPDWMRPESMRRDMMVTVLTYRGLTSRKILQTSAMSTDIVHKNAVFIRNMKLTEPFKCSIRKILIGNRMDPDSPIHDVTKIWDSGPAIELAVRVKDDFKIDDLEIYDDPFIETNKSIKVSVKPKISGTVSGSLDGIRAQFGRDNGQDQFHGIKKTIIIKTKSIECQRHDCHSQAVYSVRVADNRKHDWKLCENCASYPPYGHLERDKIEEIDG